MWFTNYSQLHKHKILLNVFTKYQNQYLQYSIHFPFSYIVGSWKFKVICNSNCVGTLQSILLTPSECQFNTSLLLFVSFLVRSLKDQIRLISCLHYINLLLSVIFKWLLQTKGVTLLLIC